jgi:hypothetical protein
MSNEAETGKTDHSAQSPTTEDLKCGSHLKSTSP